MNHSFKNEPMMTFLTRSAWRKWLSQNHQTERAIWLRFADRSASWQGISYEDAVEEALCFRWIDSVVRRVDETSRAQRFTPRRAGSAYSQLNLERLRRLAAQHRIHEAYRGGIEALLTQDFVFAEDILNGLRESPEAWAFFQQSPAAYQRIRVAHIEAARGDDALFQKRLQYFCMQCQRQKYVGQQCLNFVKALP